jgi:alginate O-acetyltransferase complex protein AlgI
MVFTSPLYVQFLVIILLVYGLLNAFLHLMCVRNQVFVQFRVIYLLIISLLFYAAWNPRYLLLLVWVSVVDFSVAQLIPNARSIRGRKRYLLFSLGNSLGVLWIFKYFGFFQENLLELMEIFGWNAHFEILRLVLPVGISFYIFQSISYVFDVYRGIMAPEKRYIHYLFYLSFFPQLVAGPIVQAKDFLPQIPNPIPFSKVEVRFALFLLLLGAFKKSVLADHLAMTSDFSFSHIGDVDREFLWLGLFSYSGQIYCDFSGYTDIAQGSALLFGFHLPENFRMPYLARGFSEFWKRWHMSLSSWLRNYLYIPLGGNREGTLRTYRNLMAVMFLGGLWHGASWNFIFWGLGHGMFLSIERFIKSIVSKLEWEKRLRPTNFLKMASGYCYMGITLISVSFLWIFFRSPKFGDSLSYLQGLFVKNGQISIPYTQGMITYFCLAAIVFGHIWGSRYFRDNEEMRQKFAKKPTNFGLVVSGALFSLGFIAVVLMSGNSLPFVYFVF